MSQSGIFFYFSSSSGKTRAELGHLPLHLRPAWVWKTLCVCPWQPSADSSESTDVKTLSANLGEQLLYVPEDHLSDHLGRRRRPGCGFSNCLLFLGLQRGPTSQIESE